MGQGTKPVWVELALGIMLGAWRVWHLPRPTVLAARTGRKPLPVGGELERCAWMRGYAGGWAGCFQQPPANSLRQTVGWLLGTGCWVFAVELRRSTSQAQRNGPNAFGAVCMRIWVPHERCEACTA